MSTTTVATPATTAGGADWRAALRPHARPHVGRAVLDLATSIVAYLALSAVGLAVVDEAWWVAALLWVPTAGFLLRTFIVFHDCGHGSFLPSRAANRWVGRVAAFLVLTPFAAWRHSHAMHHASAGDLDRRGHGDVPTMTCAEYAAAPRGRRTAYRLLRHPAIMFTIGPLWSLVVGPRIWSRDQRPKIRHSVQLTDLAIGAALAALVLTVGWWAYLVAQGPVVFLAALAGVWMFFVQHQFEDAYWRRGEAWDQAEAALAGSSYLRLPPLLRFFTGNIGLHHVHHLSARVPNYRLLDAHRAVAILREVPVLGVRDGLRATRLGLYDEEGERLVTFARAKALRTGRA